MFCIDFQIIKTCIRKTKKGILQFLVLRQAALGWGSWSLSPRAGVKCRCPAHDQLPKQKKGHT